MAQVRITGFENTVPQPVTHGLAVYRFESPIDADQYRRFISQLSDASMLPDGQRGAGSPLHCIGLRQLFALGYRPAETADSLLAHRAVLSRLGAELGLTEAWSFEVQTCVDVSERQTTGRIRWRRGAPDGTSQVRFPVAGRYPETDAGRVIPRLALKFELSRRVCVDAAGILVAFCQHWMAPFTDHCHPDNGAHRESADARCFIMGDVNIGDDGRTVRYRLDQLIVPDEPEVVVSHLLGTLDKLHDVLPIRQAWIGDG